MPHASSPAAIFIFINRQLDRGPRLSLLKATRRDIETFSERDGSKFGLRVVCVARPTDQDAPDERVIGEGVGLQAGALDHRKNVARSLPLVRLRARVQEGIECDNGRLHTCPTTRPDPPIYRIKQSAPYNSNSTRRDDSASGLAV